MKTVNEVRLSFIEKGEGEALILLHGNGENKECFGAQIDFFSKYYKVYAPDTRGHGNSPHGKGRLTLSAAADDTAFFIKDKQIERAHIVGFSDGGNIALLLAMKHPETVETLTLCGANLYPKGLKNRIWISDRVKYALLCAPSYLSEKAFKSRELLSLMVNEPHIKPDELRCVGARALVVCGENDMIKRSHSRLIADSLPNCEFAVLKGDHFLPYKNPDEFNNRVLEFLQK